MVIKHTLIKTFIAFFSSFESRGKSDSHNANSDLDSFLLANNMRKVTIPGNGNCFFLALATMILQQLSNNTLSSEAKTHLERIGLVKASNAPNADVTEIATTLRRVVVDEWLSNPITQRP